MEEARQYSVVMQKFVQYLAFAVVFMTSAQCATTSFAGTKFPDIEISGAKWKTAVGSQDFDNIQNGVSVVLAPPAGFAFPETVQILKLLHDACIQVAENPTEFAKDSTLPAPLEYIYTVLEMGNQTLFPYAMRHRLTDGKCSGSMGFQMPTLSAPFSQHDPNDEFLAVAHSWGFGPPEVSFETGTKGKVIAVEIERLKNFGRALEKVSASALCVHAIANIESEFTSMLIPIKSKNYPKIEIEIVDRIGSVVGSARKVVGRIEFAIQNGMCTPLAGGN